MDRGRAPLKRRGLIQIAAGAGALAAMGNLARSSAGKPGPQQAGSEPGKVVGYRLTDHVRRYYQSTLV